MQLITSLGWFYQTKKCIWGVEYFSTGESFFVTCHTLSHFYPVAFWDIKPLLHNLMIRVDKRLSRLRRFKILFISGFIFLKKSD